MNRFLSMIAAVVLLASFLWWLQAPDDKLTVLLPITPTPAKNPIPSVQLPTVLVPSQIVSASTTTGVTQDDGPITVVTSHMTRFMDELAALRKNVRLTINFPRPVTFFDGFIVVVPAGLNAPENPEFDPTPTNQSDFWIIKLWRIPPEGTLSRDLPEGNYDILIYRNDGDQGKLPTRVSLLSTSTGSTINLVSKYLEGLDRR